MHVMKAFMAVRVCITGVCLLIVASNVAAQSALVSSEADFKAALLDNNIESMQIQNDITLTPPNWPRRSIPDIISRNLSILGDVTKGRLVLDFGYITSRVQVQQHWTLTFKHLKIIGSEDGNPLGFLRTSPEALIVWEVSPCCWPPASCCCCTT
jgi:hypothetical protein